MRPTLTSFTQYSNRHLVTVLNNFNPGHSFFSRCMLGKFTGRRFFRTYNTTIITFTKNTHRCTVHSISSNAFSLTEISTEQNIMDRSGISRGFFTGCLKAENDSSIPSNILLCVQKAKKIFAEGNTVPTISDIFQLRTLMNECTLDDLGYSREFLTSFMAQQSKKHKGRPQKEFPNFVIPIYVSDKFHFVAFVMTKGSKLQLHDHAGMVVVAKIVAGEVRMKTYDVICPVDKNDIGIPSELVKDEFLCSCHPVTVANLNSIEDHGQTLLEDLPKQLWFQTQIKLENDFPMARFGCTVPAYLHRATCQYYRSPSKLDTTSHTTKQGALQLNEDSNSIGMCTCYVEEEDLNLSGKVRNYGAQAVSGCANRIENSRIGIGSVFYARKLQERSVSETSSVFDDRLNFATTTTDNRELECTTVAKSYLDELVQCQIYKETVKNSKTQDVLHPTEKKLANNADFNQKALNESTCVVLPGFSNSHDIEATADLTVMIDILAPPYGVPISRECRFFREFTNISNTNGFCLLEIVDDNKQPIITLPCAALS